jgi:hypothetical protein
MNRNGDNNGHTEPDSNGQHQPPATATAKPKRNRLQQRHQAARLQAFAFESAMSLKRACTNPETGDLTMSVQTAAAIHKLIGAWDTARDAVRVLRGKGLPCAVKSKAKTVADIQPLTPA